MEAASAEQFLDHDPDEPPVGDGYALGSGRVVPMEYFSTEAEQSRLQRAQNLVRDTAASGLDLLKLVTDSETRRRFQAEVESPEGSHGLHHGELPFSIAGRDYRGRYFISDVVVRPDQTQIPSSHIERLKMADFEEEDLAKQVEALLESLEGPVIIFEHGMGGSGTNSRLLQRNLPDHTFVKSHRYPKHRGDAFPDTHNLKEQFFREVYRLAAEVKYFHGQSGDTTNLHGHSIGTRFTRALVEAAHECPALIGVRDGESIDDVIPGMVLWTPPELDNGFARSPLNPGDTVITPELARYAALWLSEAVEAYERGEEVAAQVMPDWLMGKVKQVSPETLFSIALSGKFIPGRLGHLIDMESDVIQDSLRDAKHNRPSRVLHEMASLLFGHRVYAPRAKFLPEAPRTLFVSGLYDGLVSRESSRRAYQEACDLYGGEKVAHIIVPTEHGIIMDQRYQHFCAAVTAQMESNPIALIDGLNKLGGEVVYIPSLAPET